VTGWKLRHVLPGHEQLVQAVCFSPDGTTLAVAGNDLVRGEVRLWDADSGKQGPKLTGHRGPVTAVAFAPDGKTLASASPADGTVRLWDPATGKTRTTLDAGPAVVVAFSPDGKTLAAGTDEGDVALWDVGRGKQSAVVRAHGGRVTCLGFSPDGTLLASAGADLTVRLADATTGKEKLTMKEKVGWAGALAFSPDGSLLHVWDRLGGAHAWDTARGKERALTELDKEGLALQTAAFSPDARLVAGGAARGRVVVWDAASGEETANLTGHTDAVHAVAFAPGGCLLASGDWDGTVRVWAAQRPARKAARTEEAPAAGDILAQQARKDFETGEFYQKGGHAASAAFYFELVRRRYPDTSWARRAAEQLEGLRKEGARPEKEAPGRVEDGLLLYTSRREFRIPFQVDRDERRVKEVALYVSTDEGRTYQLADTTAPDRKEFTYHADRDGVFWFAVQVRRPDGKAEPETLTETTAALKLVVDTESPRAKLEPLPGSAGRYCVNWQAEDDNLDIKSLHLEWRAEGQEEWSPLPARTPSGRLLWEAPAGKSVEVRLTVSDKAGNATTCKCTVTSGRPE
jgi:hypothetical protein